jgi:hypothetical protein
MRETHMTPGAPMVSQLPLLFRPDWQDAASGRRNRTPRLRMRWLFADGRNGGSSFAEGEQNG